MANFFVGTTFSNGLYITFFSILMIFFSSLEEQLARLKRTNEIAIT
jgi:hypothetical protein